MRRYTLDGEPIDLAAFLADNADGFSEDEIQRICAMQPGETVMLGGGAAPDFILVRLTDAPAEDDVRAENKRLANAIDRDLKTIGKLRAQNERLRKSLAQVSDLAAAGLKEAEA